jgi:hypothetical protein
MVINPAPPTDWKALQRDAAAILRECGLTVETERETATARDSVVVDVYADDQTRQPHTIYLCECKHWRKRVPKTVVHAFRSVVADAGANIGFVISSAGFQTGAFEAAENTNVRLVTWNEFQETFAARWIESYFKPTLKTECDRLVSYTEPLAAPRAAENLSAAGNRRFVELHDKWQSVAFFALHFYLPISNREITSLPIRGTAIDDPELPVDIRDAASARGLLQAIVSNAHRGLAEFDELFRTGI